MAAGNSNSKDNEVSEIDCKVVAAIAFGTSCCGYAYSYKDMQEKIYINANFSRERKVPTAILFDDKKKFVEFGDDAVDYYIKFTESKKELEYMYFDQFKMTLYNKKDSFHDFHLKAANGKLMKAIDVFSEAIKYMKSRILESVEKRDISKKITLEDFRWILTVPAIWSDRAKYFMREAAEKAGIPKQKLVIALEPECAAVYCKSSPEMNRLNVDMNKAGLKYMVVDNGGGTVDITCYEKTSRDTVKEIHKASGGAWGGTNVNRLFEEYLISMLHPQVIEKVKKDNPVDWVDMMRNFEKMKRQIDETNTDTVSFMLTSSVYNTYKEVLDVDLKDAFENNICSRGATLERSRLLDIPNSVINEMLEQVCGGVRNVVWNILQLQCAKDIDCIIMVGGFSNLDILKKKIESLRRGLPVMVPEEAELAVLKGAVLYGWYPAYITSRRSKKTYGIGRYGRFDAEEHDDKYKVFDEDGEARCKNNFGTMVTINQEIDILHKVTNRFVPLLSKEKEVSINIYVSDKEKVKYIDEPGVVKLGHITIPIPNHEGKNRKERKIFVDVLFGKTEMQAEVRYAITGKSISAIFKYLD